MLTGGSFNDHPGSLNRTVSGLPQGSDRPSPDWQLEFETLRARVDQLEAQIARLDGLLSGS
jgi:cell division protein FtsB